MSAGLAPGSQRCKVARGARLGDEFWQAAPFPRRNQDAMVFEMPEIFNILVPLTLFLVFASLCFGVYAMFRGGDFGRSWSNRMMRLRVLTQFIAVVVIMTALFFVERMKGG
jgi:uncharacterized membrane protein